MKRLKSMKRIGSIIMAFAIVFGLMGMVGSNTKVQAATDKVSLYCYEKYYSKSGVARYHIYVKVNDSTYNKQVYAHIKGTVWEDIEGSYYTTLSDGSEIWKIDAFVFGLPSDFEYAIKCVVGGQTYWDNNNGNNYTVSDVIGVAPIKLNRLDMQLMGSSIGTQSYKVEAHLQNYAYNKVVKVRYTEDNWATYQDVALSFDHMNTGGSTEVWTGYLTLDGTKLDSFQYCAYFDANGIRYWDNNFGNNYNRSYHITK